MIGVKRTDKIRSERVREPFGDCKGGDNIIDESAIRWYGRMK